MLMTKSILMSIADFLYFFSAEYIYSIRCVLYPLNVHYHSVEPKKLLQCPQTTLDLCLKLPPRTQLRQETLALPEAQPASVITGSVAAPTVFQDDDVVMTPHRPTAPPGRAATLTRPWYRCLRGGFSPRSPGLPTTLPSLTPLPSPPFSNTSRYFFTTVHFSTTPSQGTEEFRLASSP